MVLLQPLFREMNPQLLSRSRQGALPSGMPLEVWVTLQTITGAHQLRERLASLLVPGTLGDSQRDRLPHQPPHHIQRPAQCPLLEGAVPKNEPFFAAVVMRMGHCPCSLLFESAMCCNLLAWNLNSISRWAG